MRNKKPNSILFAKKNTRRETMASVSYKSRTLKDLYGLHLGVIATETNLVEVANCLGLNGSLPQCLNAQSTNVYASTGSVFYRGIDVSLVNVLDKSLGV